MAEVVNLVTLGVDANGAIAAQAELNKTAKALRSELKDLRKENQEGTEEYVKLEAQLKNVQAEQRANTKVIQGLTAEQSVNAKSIEGLTRQNAALRAERNKVDVTTKEGQATLKALNAQINANDKLITQNSDNLVKQKRNVGAYEKAIKNASVSTQAFKSSNEELNQVFQLAEDAGNGFLSTLRAIALNPIVAVISALVAVVGLLVGAWAKTEAGGDQVRKIFNQINAVIDETTSRLAEVAKRWQLLLSAVALATTNIKAAGIALREATKSFEGYSEGVDAAIEGANQLTESQITLRKLQVEVTDAVADTRKEFQRNLLISRDRTKSEEERIAAVKAAGKIEAQNLENTLKLRNAQLAVAKTELETTPENLKTDEQRLKVAEAKKAVADAEADSLGKQRDILNRINDLNNQILLREQRRQKALDDEVNAEIAALEEIAQAQSEAEQERLMREVEAFQERQKLNAEFREVEKTAIIEAAQGNAFAVLAIQEQANLERYRREIELAEAIGADTTEITRRYNAAQLEIDRARYNQSLTVAGQFFGNLATAFDEGTELAKAAGAAQAVISALVAANNAYASLASIPYVGPVLGAAAAAAALAAGYGNVRAIYAVDNNKDSSTPPTSSTPSAPAVSTTGASVGQGIATRNALDGVQVPEPQTTVAVPIDDVTRAQSSDTQRNVAATV